MSKYFFLLPLLLSFSAQAESIEQYKKHYLNLSCDSITETLAEVSEIVPRAETNEQRMENSKKYVALALLRAKKCF